MKKPLISVIVTTYNRKDYLKEALDSILNQTFQDFEIVLVDDASTDGTSEMVQEYIEKLGDKIQYIKRKKNFGQHTRPKNEGLKAARADWVCYLDDDNWYRKDHLQVLWKTHEVVPDVDVLYGDRVMLDGDRTQIGVRSDFSLQKLQMMNYIDTSDVLHKKADAIEIGGWDETLQKFADWNLWLRLAKKGRTFKRVPIIISEYRVHEGMNQLKTPGEIDPKTGLIKPTFDAVDCKINAEKSLFKTKPLKVAVFTLTYDRLEYTKRTFETMADLAGYSYDHFVVDNGSTDGTVDWLKEQDLHKVILNKENVGISHASNQALDIIGNKYDIIVKVDNDCEFLTEDWLATMVDIFERSQQFAMSPYVEGLIDNPGGTPRQRPGSPGVDPYGYLGKELISFTNHLGGICIAAPAFAYKDFRWRDNDFYHGIQDAEFSQHCLTKMRLNLIYLENVRVEHQDNTRGQQNKFPEYFKRREKEKTTRYEHKQS